MQQIIFYEIQTASVCPYRLLFSEKFFEPLLETVPFKSSNIYLFARVKKVRFDLSHTYLLNKRTLKTRISIGNKLTKDLTISFFETVPVFKHVFTTRDNFDDLLSDEDDFWECKIDSENSSADKIHFLQSTRKGEQVDFWLIPENLETATELIEDVTYVNKPEVVYVGQSFQMPIRIKSHKTLHKAVSLLNDDEEIRIYFLTFKYGYFANREQFNIHGQVSKTWLSGFGTSPEFRDKISLVERFLIHFFKPIYNEQHVNAKITNDSLVKSILINNHIDIVSTNLEVNESGFEFWSPNQPLKSSYVSFNFQQPELGYQDGLITNLDIS
jgi:hypothetical protein